MKVWTVQQMAAVQLVLSGKIYQPNFSLSPSLRDSPELSLLYEKMLQAYDNINHLSLPGLVFCFARTDNDSVWGPPNINAFKEMIIDSKGALKTLWAKLGEGSPVILELEYTEPLNPLMVNLNDFQALMPPFVEMPPFYTKTTVSDLQDMFLSGRAPASPFPCPAAQLVYPFIAPYHLIDTYPYQSIEIMEQELAQIPEDPDELLYF